MTAPVSTSPPEAAPSLPERVADRLGRERHMWLCTLRPDGSPHITPMWFVYVRDRWWFSTGRRGVKVRNIRADARVSVHLEDGAVPVVAEGEAREHRGDFPEDVVAAFAAKYDGWDITAPVGQHGCQLLFGVEVRRWLLLGKAG